MSDITNEKTKHAVYAGITVDIAEDSLDRVQKLLAGISGGWQKAVGSALSRAAAAGRTEAKKPILAEYAIDQSTYLSETRTINHFERSADGSVSVAFAFAGYVIPLLRFNTSVDSSGQVVTQVKRGSAATALDHARLMTLPAPPEGRDMGVGLRLTLEEVNAAVRKMLVEKNITFVLAGDLAKGGVK